MFVSVVLLLICVDLAISVKRIVGLLVNQKHVYMGGNGWRFGRTESDLILGGTSFEVVKRRKITGEFFI